MLQKLKLTVKLWLPYMLSFGTSISFSVLHQIPMRNLPEKEWKLHYQKSKFFFFFSSEFQKCQRTRIITGRKREIFTLEVRLWTFAYNVASGLFVLSRSLVLQVRDKEGLFLLVCSLCWQRFLFTRISVLKLRILFEWRCVRTDMSLEWFEFDGSV